MRSVSRLGLHAVILFPLVASSGCGGGSTPEPPTNRLHIERLGQMIRQYQNQNQGQSPTNAQQLKAFLAKLSQSQKDNLRETLKISNPEDLLISPRDQKPYLINWKLPSPMTMTKPGVDTGASMPHLQWVACEAEGVNGKRFVVSAYGSAEEVDEQTFRARYPDAK